MEKSAVLDQLDRINVWKRGDQRAPHKPLLILLALGRLSRGETRLPFVECEGPLSELLTEFGPSRAAHHPEYPFWRLQNDGIWEVSGSLPEKVRESSGDPTKTLLREQNAAGSFAPGIREALVADPSLVSRAAQQLLAAHFPESLHQDILDAVGLDLKTAISGRRTRDPGFRTRVLVAYEYQCAVCGLDLRIANATIGLEAAHIKWHQAGGPDSEDNGLALCSIHHKVLDVGAITVDPDHGVLVSELANGSSGFEDVLLRHHGSRLRQPQNPSHVPRREFLLWHRREVFKEGARFLGNDR